MDVQIGHEPEEKARQQEPLALCFGEPAAHRTPKEEHHDHRQKSAQQLQQRHGQPRRPDAGGRQPAADDPRHEGLHAGAHLQRILPGQMVDRRGSEELHVGIFEDLVVFVGVVDAPAQQRIEQGHQASRHQNLSDGDPSKEGKQHDFERLQAVS